MMPNEILNLICNDENDTMLCVKIYCKHEDLLSMQTSWSKGNSSQRFWSCPRYRVCTFLHLSPWRREICLIYFIFYLNFFLCGVYFRTMYATSLDRGFVKKLIYDPSSLFSNWQTKLRGWKLIMKVILKEVPSGG